jgi:hypothetical protein
VYVRDTPRSVIFALNPEPSGWPDIVSVPVGSGVTGTLHCCAVTVNVTMNVP